MMSFHPVTREWFLGCFEEPTRAQELSWRPIHSGHSTLLLAPTGSGKTLSAFLSALDRLMFSPTPEVKGVRVLYVSPLKALAVDIERNLRSPLIGIQALAHQRGVEVVAPIVGVRTGDTTQAERSRMLRKPPHILITTPESLYLMATSKARDLFQHLECVIIDEIHTMVNSKRGAHLALTLERIERRRQMERPLQRIGLSATQTPLSEVSRFLGGFERTPNGSAPRPVEVVDAGEAKRLTLTVEMPAEEFIEQDPEDLLYGVSNDGTVRSSWANLVPRIVDLIQERRSTIVFVNSRRTAEKLAAALNERAGILLAQAHHGSLSHDIRAQIEDQLKLGHLPAIVATASLELGIDMGAVERVIQVGAFPSVTSGLQRVGRARHHVGGVPEGVSFPKHPADLLASAVVGRCMLDGAIESSRYPRNPLDILAQQVAAMVAMDEWAVDELHQVVQQSAPFAELSRGMLENVLDMMSGRYPADDFSDLRPTIVWDRVADTLHPRRGLQKLAVINGGTIADRGLYGVFLYDDTESGSRRVGELDEEMVFESRVGDVFLLGASSWRIEEITHDRVLVSPAPGVPGRMPFWKGDQLGRSYEVGTQIGAFCRAFQPTQEEETRQQWQAEMGLAENACDELWEFLSEQADLGALPSDRCLVIERFMDEIGDWRICILSPHGSAVHGPWAMAVRAQLWMERDIEVDVMWSDDGIVFRVSDGDHELPTSAFLPAPDAVEDILLQRLSETPFFGARFRENAGRSLLLPKRKPGRRSPLWALRRRAASLLKVAAEFRDFPIVLETYRECLADHFDMTSLQTLLRGVHDQQIRVVDLPTDVPSPFASSLMFQYIANFIYDGDAPLAERRAQALTIDQTKLRELMGTAALRSLLDEESIKEVVAQLQRLTHPAPHLDALHSVLMELGPLSQSELLRRYAPRDGEPTDYEPLLQQNRIFRFKFGSETRFAAVEDAARLRDALGIVIPMGVPLAFQEPAERPVRDLIRRYVRTHGPHRIEDLVEQLGLAAGVVREQLNALEREGQLIAGEFSPAVEGQEWCDTDVLRRIKRRALAKLRAQVEAIEPQHYVDFLVRWHRLGGSRRGNLLDIIERLQGYALPSHVLETEVLPSRLAGHAASDLDGLCSSGQVVWIGDGSLGKDTRVRLYLREHLARLHEPSPPLEDPLCIRIRELLRERGSLFFDDIKEAIGGFPPPLVDALWQLVRNGEVSNDTLLPLRSLRRGVTISNKKRRRNRSRHTNRRRHIQGTQGRWWLVEGCMRNVPDETERAMARATMMLERYGVLCREAFSAEGLKGGFSRTYPVLKMFEERGRARRGFFVDTLGATQFALPGVEDRLRVTQEEDTAPLWMSILDPAQPYGSILEWPTDFPVKPVRNSGCQVLIRAGEVIAVLQPNGTHLRIREPEDDATRHRLQRGLQLGLAKLPQRLNQRVVFIETINGTHARGYAGLPGIAPAGHQTTGKGLMLRIRSDDDATPSSEALSGEQRYFGPRVDGPVSTDRP